MDKNKDSGIILNFKTRSEWHHFFLVNLVIIIGLMLIVKLITNKLSISLTAGVPFLTFICTSPFFSFKKCPIEPYNWNIKDTVLSLIMLWIASVLTIFLIGTPWAYVFCLYFLLLLVGSPKFAFDHDDTRNVLDESLSNQVKDSSIFIQPMAKVCNSDEIPLSINQQYEIGIIVGLLGVYSKDFKIEVRPQHIIDYKSINGLIVSIQQKEEDIIKLSIYGGNYSLDLEIDTSNGIEPYRDLILSLSQLIRNSNQRLNNRKP